MNSTKYLYHFTSGDCLEDIIVITTSTEKALSLNKESQELHEFDKPHPFDESCFNFKVKVFPEEPEGVKEHHYIRDIAWM